MSVGTLIGYFSKQEEARRALRELVREGFNRVALIHKSLDGDVHITDSFIWRRALGIILFACLFGGIAEIAFLFLNWSMLHPIGNISTSLNLIFACTAFGVLVALLLLRRSKYGVELGVMRDHERWLLPGESVLILQAPVESLQRPVAMLSTTPTYSVL